MVKILLNNILEGTASEFSSLSTNWDIGTRFFEKDTNTWYILEAGDVGNVWQNQSPVDLSSTTMSSKFIPVSDMTGLTFGEAHWQGVAGYLLADGSMVYPVQTRNTGTDYSGYTVVDYYALPEMLPKIEVKCVIDDDTSSTAMFIGLVDNSVTNFGSATSLMSNASTYINSNLMHVGIGARTTDSEWQIVNNDASGTPNFQSTGVSRDTNFHTFIIQYITPTSVTLTIKNTGGTILAQITKTTEIPPPGNKLQFHLEIRNADTVRVYGIWIYDYIYLEKKIPIPTGSLAL